MMTAAAMAFAVLLGSAVQALLPASVLFGAAKAPVLLGTALYYALTRSRNVTFAAGLLAGLFQDANGLVPLGFSSVSFCLVGLVVYRYRDVVFVYRAVTHMVIGAVSAGAVTMLLALALAGNGMILLSPAWLVSKVIGSMVLGAVTIPIVFRFIEGLETRLGIQEARAA